MDLFNSTQAIFQNKTSEVKKKKTEVPKIKDSEKSFDDLLEEMVETNKSVNSGIKKILKDIEKRNCNPNN